MNTAQSQQLDEIVTILAPTIHETLDGLVKAIAATTLEERYGKVWSDAERNSAEARVYAATEKEVASELATRLQARLLNPHAAV